MSKPQSPSQRRRALRDLERIQQREQAKEARELVESQPLNEEQLQAAIVPLQAAHGLRPRKKIR